jgi:hypothetical protein
MKTIVDKLTKVSPYTENDSFKDYIVVSSDSLLIIDKDLELVEWIIEGNSTDGVYMSADTLDDFLDAIIFLKHLILSGNNPLEWCKQ